MKQQINRLFTSSSLQSTFLNKCVYSSSQMLFYINLYFRFLIDLYNSTKKACTTGLGYSEQGRLNFPCQAGPSRSWGAQDNAISSSCCVIVRVRVVLKRTVVGDWRFDNLSGKSSSDLFRVKWTVFVLDELLILLGSNHFLYSITRINRYPVGKCRQNK